MRHGRGVRWIFLLFGCGFACSLAQGQQQERKLIDRLLRPDLSLGNPAQDKKFSAAGGTSPDRKFVAKSFYSRDAAITRTFAGGKNFSSKKFRAQQFSRGDAVANINRTTAIPKAEMQFPTRASALVRDAPESGKVVKGHDYAGNRPFLAKGTRQKILSQQDKPLTIEQIRELLNKSK